MKSPRNAGKGGIKVTKEKLSEILEAHKAWLNDEPNGICADLRRADLSGADGILSSCNYLDAHFERTADAVSTWLLLSGCWKSTTKIFGKS